MRPQPQNTAAENIRVKNSGINPAGERRMIVAVCLFLATVVGIVYGQALGFGFVNYDDGLNVYENPHVVHGLTTQGISWSFTRTQVGRWAPVTAISHLLDCTFYGLWPGGHHLTSLLFHLASAILLFLALREMTGALWRSASVATLFAIHPLSVESVAWISARGEVMAGFFFMATLWTYTRYVRKRQSKVCRWIVALLFMLCLMSKSAPVMLPFLLLLLDWWPLSRMPDSSDRREFLSTAKALFLEKWQLFAISAIFCAAALMAQGEKMKDEPISLLLRVENALASYVIYILQMFWPARLAALYPHRETSLTLLEVSGAILMLAVLSAFAWQRRKQKPWFLVGWLWYLGMLLPVLGIVVVGNQARADRYTYLPNIGLYLLVTWTVSDLSLKLHWPRWMLRMLSAAVIVPLIMVAHKQTAYWRDSESLWNHTLACTGDNPVALNNLGSLLQQEGRLEEAIPHFEKALEIKPGFVQAHANLGLAFQQTGQLDTAIAHLRTAVELNPDFAEAHGNLGIALYQKGNPDEAIMHYQKALDIKPDDARVHSNLGAALQQKGRLDDAIAHFQTALQLEPLDAVTLNNLGFALQQKGLFADAITHYERSLEIRPDNAGTLNNLAWLLATCPDAGLRNGARAIDLAKQATQLSKREQPYILRTLAAAYAETRRFADAIRTAQKAAQAANAAGNPALSETIQSDINLYESQTPLRFPNSKK